MKKKSVILGLGGSEIRSVEASSTYGMAVAGHLVPWPALAVFRPFWTINLPSTVDPFLAGVSTFGEQSAIAAVGHMAAVTGSSVQGQAAVEEANVTDWAAAADHGSAFDSLAVGQTYQLTTGVDTFTGTADDDTFQGSALTFRAGDFIVGGGGIDTFRIDGSQGYVFLDTSVHIAGIERLVIDGAFGGLNIREQTLSDVTHIEFTSQQTNNNNAINFIQGSYDLRGKTFIGLEEITLNRSQIVTDSKALALSVRASSSEDTKITLSGGTFTLEERRLLFSKGILTVEDSSGTYTNAVPTFTNLNGDAQRVLMGGSVLIDRNGDSTFSDDSLPATLFIGLFDFWEEDRLGISMDSGIIDLPDGMQIGGRVFVNGNHIGTIEEDGTWYGGLLIRFNGDATAQDVQALVRSVTYTSLNPDNASPHIRTIAVVVTDEFGVQSSTNQVTVKVENPLANPTIALSRTAHRISDTESVQAFAGVVLGDPSPDGSYTLIVKLDAAHKGILTGYTAGTFEDGTYTVQGTRQDIQTQLRLLTFVPTDRDAPNAREATILTVTVRDPDLNEGRATVTVISVDGVPHHDPENITLSNSLVFEHEASETVVGYLSGFDADGDTLSYSLVDNADGRFVIDGNAIKVANGAKIDFEQMRQHQVTVRADDGWGHTTDKVFQIDVRNVLHERVTGTSAGDRIEGGIGKDEFKGENGNDTLIGGGGNDTLWGGAGEDIFVFRHVGTSNKDEIRDFNLAQDKIQLSRTEAFSALTTIGVLDAGALQVGTRALEADDRIIYNPTTGQLFYDSDGTGSRAAVEFALLDPGLSLLNTHFIVI